MKIKLIIILAFINFYASAQDSIRFEKRKLKIPVGLFTQENTSIYGLSIGVGSDLRESSKENYTASNGIRIEPISDALLIVTSFFGPDGVSFPDDAAEFADFQNKFPNEIVNGLNLSAGTNAFIKVNGITLSAITQSIKQSNGISVGGLASSSFKSNGIQIAYAGTSAVFSNGIIASALNTSVHTGTGLQVGGFNQYKNFSGLQVGIFNDIESESEKFAGLQIGVFNNTKKLKGIQLGLWNVNEKRSLPIFNWNFKN
jgi:primosomal replication protein N